MIHDPLCVLSKPCDEETPEHGYCGFSAPNFCIHCHQWCMCGEIRQAEQRMLAKCIEALRAQWPDPCVSMCGGCRVCWACMEWARAHDVLRALQEQ